MRNLKIKKNNSEKTSISTIDTLILFVIVVFFSSFIIVLIKLKMYVFFC